MDVPSRMRQAGGDKKTKKKLGQNVSEVLWAHCPKSVYEFGNREAAPHVTQKEFHPFERWV